MKRKQRKQRSRWLAILLVILALAVWLFWQQNGLSTEVISVKGAPEGFYGFRIAIVSDNHGKEFGRNNQNLLSWIQNLHPDLIAVTGDLIHDPKQMDMVPALAKGLSEIAPTYYVTGNHEWAVRVVPELEELLEECGVTVLSNRYTVLEQKGDVLALLGAEDSNGYADQKTIGELADEVRQEQGHSIYTLLLCHRNDRWPEYQAAHIDLTLAGHAHGGVIRLPGTDGLLGHGRKILPQYTAGLYDLAWGQMVVSRGLGNQPPLFRMFNRPDVPLVVLGDPSGGVQFP